MLEVGRTYRSRSGKPIVLGNTWGDDYYPDGTARSGEDDLVVLGILHEVFYDWYWTRRLVPMNDATILALHSMFPGIKVTGKYMTNGMCFVDTVGERDEIIESIGEWLQFPRLGDLVWTTRGVVRGNEFYSHTELQEDWGV